MKHEPVLEYRVPYADTDQAGVVYYANYLVYFEMARAEFLRKAGMSYTQMEQAGYKLPVIEAVCRYKNSARFEDLIAVEAWISEAKGVRLKMECRVMRGDEVLAEGHTVHACINSSGRPVKLPPELISLLAESGV